MRFVQIKRFPSAIILHTPLQLLPIISPRHRGQQNKTKFYWNQIKYWMIATSFARSPESGKLCEDMICILWLMSRMSLSWLLGTMQTQLTHLSNIIIFIVVVIVVRAKIGFTVCNKTSVSDLLNCLYLNKNNMREVTNLAQISLLPHQNFDTN